MLDGQVNSDPFDFLTSVEHKRRHLTEFSPYNEKAQDAPLNGPYNLFIIFQDFWIHTIALDKD